MELAKIHIDFTTIFPLIKEILQNAQVTEEIFRKHIQVDPKDKETIQKVINLLVGSESETLRLITVDLQRIFADGVIDVNDIPIIVKIITDVLNNKSAVLSSLFKSPLQVSILIKMLVIVLGRLDVFNNYMEDEQRILKIVDSSLALLATSIQLSGGCKCC